MVAQETQQNPQEKEHQLHDQDPYEEEETLSLCDLPTHSDSAHWEDFSKEYQSSSFDNDEDNFFEFFSEEFTASTYPSGGKDIIFCGKLIPFNKEAPNFSLEKGNQTQAQEICNTKRTKKGFFRSWRSSSRVSKPVLQVKETRTINTSLSFSGTSKNYRKYELNKVSILSSTPSKSKWYLFMFGMARFPTEMELRDIRTRQSRRRPSTMFRACDEDREQLSPKGKKEKNNNNKNRPVKGLWGLLRAVGCRSSHANAVVKAGLF